MTRPDWASSGSFFTLCQDLQNKELELRVKVALAEAFCVKKVVSMGALVDYILYDQSPALTVDLVKLLLLPPQSSPPAATAASAATAEPLPAAAASAPAASAAARAAGVSDVTDDVRRLPSATRVDLAARQKELLQGYGKKEVKDELEELRDTPDPLDAPGAKEILLHGGAPAEQLRQKRKLWERAQKVPTVKKEGGHGGKGVRVPPRLQLMAWIIAPDSLDELTISSFGTPSSKLRDDDFVHSALEQLLAKHVYDPDTTPLDLNDLVVLDADDPRLVLWNSSKGKDDITLSIDLFKHNTSEREVYLAPRSRLHGAFLVIKERIKEMKGASPRRGKLGGTVPVRRRDGEAGARHVDKPERARHANNLYMEWRKSQTASKLSTAEIASEWQGLAEQGQAQWLEEHDLLGADSPLSSATRSKYLAALGKCAEVQAGRAAKKAKAVEPSALDDGGSGDDDQDDDREVEQSLRQPAPDLEMLVRATSAASSASTAASNIIARCRAGSRAAEPGANMSHRAGRPQRQARR